MLPYPASCAMLPARDSVQQRQPLRANAPPRARRAAADRPRPRRGGAAAPSSRCSPPRPSPRSRRCRPVTSALCCRESSIAVYPPSETPTTSASPSRVHSRMTRAALRTLGCIDHEPSHPSDESSPWPSASSARQWKSPHRAASCGSKRWRVVAAACRKRIAGRLGSPCETRPGSSVVIAERVHAQISGTIGARG
eukprot:3864324-Prymnesium_polylepis.1